MTVPAEAIEAAVKAVPFVNRDALRRALEAAAPVLAEAERQPIVRKILAQQQPCAAHPHPFPKPSCWICARNGAFHRAALIAAGEFGDES